MACGTHTGTGRQGIVTTLILGCGFSGKAIATAFAAAGNSVGNSVIGTSRSAAKQAAIEAAGAKPLVFDGTHTPELAAAFAASTRLILSISPDQGGDPVLPLLPRLAAVMPKLEWAAYLSTVGVYGDHNGAWVDEETPPRPVSARSIARTEAEQAWQNVFAAHDIPLAVLRLSGIYGPGRNQIKTAMEGGARRLVKPGQMFNRIRVEDIARATVFLAAGRHGGIYNVTDDAPAPPQDVVAYACTLAGVDMPPEQDFATAELTPMARSFYGENKKVSNAKIKALGFSFAYPHYRMSLAQLWQDGVWQG
jgi:nucleoside-diphosphate-sugar epimerase